MGEIAAFAVALLGVVLLGTGHGSSAIWIGYMVVVGGLCGLCVALTRSLVGSLLATAAGTAIGLAVSLFMMGATVARSSDLAWFVVGWVLLVAPVLLGFVTVGVSVALITRPDERGRGRREPQRQAGRSPLVLGPTSAGWLPMPPPCPPAARLPVATRTRVPMGRHGRAGRAPRRSRTH